MGAITLQWQDNNTDETGHRVYRSIGTPLDKANLPAPVADLGINVTSYVDEADFKDEIVYYIISAYKTEATGEMERFSEVYQFNSNAQYAPGPYITIGGDANGDGFFGEVSSTELFTGDELATELGFTSGTSMNSTEPWLKFASGGKIIFVNKKPIRNNISWDQINAVDAVYGTRTITKDGYTYKVRLLTGAEADPGSEAGGEWNNLIYKVHVDDPTNSNWASYTDADLVVGVGDGHTSWMQEASASVSTERITRGRYNFNDFRSYAASMTGVVLGWRAVLEVVE